MRHVQVLVKGELEIKMILMMTLTKLAMAVRIVHKIFTRYECMDFGACVDVSDEEDPRAICECQVIFTFLKFLKKCAENENRQ